MFSHNQAFEQIKSLLRGETDFMPCISLASAFLMQSMPDINWAGFYFVKGSELVLSSFQGKPACIRLPYGKGVCWTAVLQNQTVVVPEVEKFSGHIACDSASRSEIVIPLSFQGKVIGVLDIDSPIPRRFTSDDKIFLEKIVSLLESGCGWEKLTL